MSSVSPDWSRRVAARCLFGIERDVEPVAFVVVGWLGSAAEWLPGFLAESWHCQGHALVRISTRELLLLHPDVPHVFQSQFEVSRLETQILPELRAAERYLTDECLSHRLSVVVEYSGLEHQGLSAGISALRAAAYQVHLLFCPCGRDAFQTRVASVSSRLRWLEPAERWWSEAFGSGLQKTCKGFDAEKLLPGCASCSIVMPSGERETVSGSTTDGRTFQSLTQRMVPQLGMIAPKATVPPASPAPPPPAMDPAVSETASEKRVISSGKGFKLVGAKREPTPPPAPPPPPSSSAGTPVVKKPSVLGGQGSTRSQPVENENISSESQRAEQVDSPPPGKPSGRDREKDGSKVGGSKPRPLPSKPSERALGAAKLPPISDEDSEESPRGRRRKAEPVTEPETLSGEELRAKPALPDMDALPPIQKRAAEKRLDLVRKARAMVDRPK